MQIWVDADACPKAIKEILFRSADRTKTALTCIANQRIALPPSEFITLVQVPSGPDVADDEICARCQPGDLVITADIPLAARVVEKGALALDPRGRLYDRENIRQILGMRDFMDSLRGSGIETGGPSGFGPRERNLFANQLDQILQRK
ncbi:MAG: YaiI/YqxD family protein [Alphaproteobacteria bacterium]